MRGRRLGIPRPPARLKIYQAALQQYFAGKFTIRKPLFLNEYQKITS
jgi:hypothetical protein